jgi:hypothetical protein
MGAKIRRIQRKKHAAGSAYFPARHLPELEYLATPYK